MTLEAAPGLIEPDDSLGPIKGPWQIALRRLLRKKLALAALLFITIFYFAGLFAPLVAPHDFRGQDLENTLTGPSIEAPFGTDRLGRDQLSRVIWSARTTIIVNFGDANNLVEVTSTAYISE